MSSTRRSNGHRSTRRVVAAAAGTGMIFASFAGAAGSAAASTHHRIIHHRVSAGVRPNIPVPADGVTATAGAPTKVADTALQGGASVALPAVTIGDPGIIKNGDTITLSLVSVAAGDGFDTTAVPTITVTGGTAATAAVTASTVKFVITKATDGTHATYVLSGLKLVGNSTASSGAFGVSLSAGTPGTPAGTNNTPPAVPPTVDATVAPFVLGAVTRIIPAAAGATAPDTAALLFHAEVGAPSQGSPSSAVLASTAEPRDAESANYLATSVPSPRTGILLTDPGTLSPAVISTLNAYGTIRTVYIVGGTSVVSAGVATSLQQRGYTVIRLAGATAYDTNSYVVNYVAQNFRALNGVENLDYTIQSRYNDTSGASSPSTTGLTNPKTAIVASGDSHAFQDGIVSGALSFSDHLPVILTSSTSLSPTALGLLTQGGYKQVILIGGPGAVSNAVEAKLVASTDSGGAGVAVFPVAGQTAADTATKVAAFEGIGNEADSLAYRDQGSPDGGVIIARGTGFQDPLAAGPYAGSTGDTPILLTDNATVLGAPLAAYLKTVGGGGIDPSTGCIFAVQAVGGPASVSTTVQQAAVDAEFSGLNNTCLASRT